MKGLFYGLVATLGVSLAATCGTKPAEQQAAKGTRKVGQLEVTLLTDTQFSPPLGIFKGLTPELRREYFPDSTVSFPVNSFLVKTPTQRILVDAGTGASLVENLKLANTLPEEIDAVLITHVHYDHVMGLASNDSALFPKAKIYISAADTAFINDDVFVNGLAEEHKAGFLLVRKVLGLYAGRIVSFTPGELEAEGCAPLFDGILAIEAYGHTPGHTAYLLDSGGERLLIWGDVVHYAPLQMPHPEIQLTYDWDSEMAMRTRSRVLKFVADNKLAIAGMHIAAPSMGTVSAKGDGTYGFTPLAD